MQQSVESSQIPVADTNPGQPERPRPPADEEGLAGRVLSRRYELIRQIGRGGMGSVYLGRHVALDRHFAVKVLSRRRSTEKQATERFLCEARATAQLRHENIVEVYDFGISQGLIYLVMEYLDGEDLAVTLHRDGPMPWHRVSRILLQVCAALHAAHQRRIVHRDVKPGNCFRVLSADAGDVIKVLDFGVAKVLGTGADDCTGLEIDTQPVVGTPEYMAPENFAGGPIDGRVDVYAVGMLGYHLLTGRLPFSRGSSEFLQQVRAGVRRSPGETEPRLRIPAIADAILMRSLRPLVSERFQTIAELGAAIAAAVDPTPPPDAATPTTSAVTIDDEGVTTRRTVHEGATIRWRVGAIASRVVAALGIVGGF